MPGEVIDQPNPPPLESRLPQEARKLLATPSVGQLTSGQVKSLKDFQRAACYIAGGTQQVFRMSLTFH